MSGPFPYAGIQYQEAQNLIFPHEVKRGDRLIWDIAARTPLFFASSTNKGAPSFFQGAAIARDPSGSGFILANNATLAGAAIGLACLGAPATQPEIVQIAGLFTMDDWTPITGAKDLAAVSSYWLSGTPGQLVAAMPAPPAIGQLVGVAISPRSMMIVTDDSQSIPAYGEIFIENNVTPLVLTNQNQFYVITPGWTANHVSGFTADTANNRLICNTPNIYQLTGVIDFSGPSNQVFEFAVFVNGVQQGHITAHSQPRGAGQFICTTIIGLHMLAAGDTIDLRADCDTAPGQSITVIHANLGATKLG